MNDVKNKMQYSGFLSRISMQMIDFVIVLGCLGVFLFVSAIICGQAHAIRN